MSTCRKMVEGKGAGVAYPCDLGLPENHDGPCAAKEKPASVAARNAWAAERTAGIEEALGIAAFQSEHRTADYVENPAPYPGERGFPQMPREWEVHVRQSDQTEWAWVPIIKRWLPVHRGVVSEQVVASAPRTVTIALPDGSREQRVVLPRAQVTSETVLAEPEDFAEAARLEREAHPMQTLRVQDQPPPEESEGDVWAEIIQDMVDRRQHGLDEYGTPLQRFNGRDAMVDAYQEALDLLVYFRQFTGEREILKALYAQVYAHLDLATLKPEVIEAAGDLARLLGVVPGTIEGDEGEGLNA